MKFNILFLFIVLLLVKCDCNHDNSTLEIDSNDVEYQEDSNEANSNNEPTFPPPSVDDIAREKSVFKGMSCADIISKLRQIQKDHQNDIDKLIKLMEPFETDIISNIDCRNDAEYDKAFNSIKRAIKKLKKKDPVKIIKTDEGVEINLDEY